MTVQKNHQFVYLSLMTGLLSTAALATVAPQVNATEVSTTDTETRQPIIYTVKTGDNLYRLAINHGLTLDQLKTLNSLTSDDLQIGDELIIGYETEPKAENPLPTTETDATNQDNITYYPTLDEAIKVAKASYDYNIHETWKVDWTEKGYIVTLVPKEETTSEAADSPSEQSQPEDNQTYYATLDEAINAAKTEFDSKKYANWKVDWTEKGYVTEFIPKVATENHQPAVEAWIKTESQSTEDSVYYDTLDEAIEVAKQTFDAKSYDNWQVDWTKNGYFITYLPKASNNNLGNDNNNTSIDEPERPEVFNVNYFNDLYQAISEAKRNFDATQYKNWRVDWTEQGYKVCYIPKSVAEIRKSLQSDTINKPNENVPSPQYFSDLNQAIDQAKRTLQDKQASNWQVNWTPNGYVIEYL